MYLAAELNLQADQGTAFDKTITWTGSSLFGYTASFIVKRGITTVLEKTNITAGTPNATDVQITLTSTEMSDLSKGRYTYHVDLLDAQNNRSRLLRGQLRVV